MRWKRMSYMHRGIIEACIEANPMSGVFRNIDPPTPLPPASVYPPPLVRRGGHTLWVERGWGANTVRKTPDTALYVSTVCLHGSVDSLEGVIAQVGEGLQVVDICRWVVAEAPWQEDLIRDNVSLQTKIFFLFDLHLWVQCYLIPDRCVPDRKFLDVAPLWQSVPWILCPWPNHPIPKYFEGSNIRVSPSGAKW